jgi:hypothetical protein
VRRVRLLLLVLCALAFSREARALGPADIEVGARVGAASNPVGGGFPNPLGGGAGARAGVSFLGFYAGVSGVYYFGESGKLKEEYANGEILSGSVSVQSFLCGGELGYGITISRLLVLRAQLGLGDDIIFASGAESESDRYTNSIFLLPVSGTTQYLYLEPGLTALLEVGKLYAGIDVNALILPSGPSMSPPTGGSWSANSPFSSRSLDVAVTTHVQVGVRF